MVEIRNEEGNSSKKIKKCFSLEPGVEKKKDEEARGDVCHCLRDRKLEVDNKRGACKRQEQNGELLQFCWKAPRNQHGWQENERSEKRENVFEKRVEINMCCLVKNECQYRKERSVEMERGGCIGVEGLFYCGEPIIRIAVRERIIGGH